MVHDDPILNDDETRKGRLSIVSRNDAPSGSRWRVGRRMHRSVTSLLKLLSPTKWECVDLDQIRREVPRIEVSENPSEILLIIDLRGFEHEPPHIRLDKGNSRNAEVVISVSAPHLREYPLWENEDRDGRTDSPFVTITQRISVPTTIDASRIEAEWRADTLTLFLPKQSESVGAPGLGAPVRSGRGTGSPVPIDHPPPLALL